MSHISCRHVDRTHDQGCSVSESIGMLCFQKGGGYKNTCKSIQYIKANGGTIVASCDDGKGKFPRATLTNVDSCKKGMENNFGKLQCD